MHVTTVLSTLVTAYQTYTGILTIIIEIQRQREYHQCLQNDLKSGGGGHQEMGARSLGVGTHPSTRLGQLAEKNGGCKSGLPEKCGVYAHITYKGKSVTKS